MSTRRILVYCDESSQTNAKYMVYGSLWVDADYVSRILDDFYYCKNGLATMKWGRVSMRFLDNYKCVASLFIKWSKDPNPKLWFNSAVFNNSLLDYDTYSAGDAELGYYKFWYQLIYHRIRDSMATYYVVMDSRSNRNSNRLTDLRGVLNRKLNNRLQGIFDRVREIRVGQTRLEPFLQINDILTGAVAWYWNDRWQNPNADPAKVILYSYLCSLLGRKHLGPTPKWEPRFNVWPFSLRLPARMLQDGMSL